MVVPMKRILLGATLASVGAAAHAAPTYTSTLFATAPAGSSGPDSVAVGAGSIWISYDGGSLSSDGSQPAGFSTVARYSPSGALQTTYQIAGDVDGLKYNAATGTVWALQNQDANSRLTFINPTTNALTPQTYAVTSPTQGYDDVVFGANGTFLSYTNPSAPTDVTLQKVVPGTSPIQVTNLLTAGSPGKNLVTGAAGYVPATANTDSLKQAPNGDLVQTTGARNTLAFIHDAGLATQSLAYLPLTSGGATVAGLDDSLYVTSASGKIYAAVSNTDQVLEIDYAGFTPGTLIASVGSLQEIGFVDPATGNVTPFVTGLPGIHGLDIVADVPEPASIALLSGAAFALLGLRRRRA